MAGVPLNALFYLGAVVLMAGLAAGLLRLDPRSRVHRAFAYLLLLRAALDSVIVLILLQGGTAAQGPVPGGRAIVYYQVGVLFAIVYFALAYLDRYGSRRGRWLPRPVPWGLLAGGLAVAALVATGPAPGPGEGSYVLRAVTPAKYLALGGAGLLLGWDATRALGARRQALLLVALGFSLDPLWHGAGSLAVALGTLGGLPVPTPLPFQEGDFQLAMVPWFLPPLLLGLGLGALALRLRPRPAVRYLAALLAPVPLAVGTYALALAAGARATYPVWSAIDGVFVLALPLLAAYALLRHELFDLDVKVKWTIKQSTVAAVFIGVFFMVSESAQVVFAESIGPVLGIAAAGMLVFALAPLQRAAERVATAALPGARAPADMSRDERARAYLEAARQAWADGSLSRDERAMLDRMREVFGLGEDEAHRLEREAARGVG